MLKLNREHSKNEVKNTSKNASKIKKPSRNSRNANEIKTTPEE